MTPAGSAAIVFLILMFVLAFGYMIWADRRESDLDNKEIDRLVREFETRVGEKSSSS